MEGVANVNVSGSLTDEVVIELNQQALKDNRLSQGDVVNAIRANNMTAPGDTIKTDGQTLTTRVVSKLQSVDELKGLVLQVNPQTGKKLKLSDVAKVEQRKEETNTITRANEESAILFSVLQQSDANTASVSKAFQKELERLLKQDQYKSIKADILFDQGDYITQAIGNIANSLLIGGAFAMLVLFLIFKKCKKSLDHRCSYSIFSIVTFVSDVFLRTLH